MQSASLALLMLRASSPTVGLHEPHAEGLQPDAELKELMRRRPPIPEMSRYGALQCVPTLAANATTNAVLVLWLQRDLTLQCFLT